MISNGQMDTHTYTGPVQIRLGIAYIPKNVIYSQQKLCKAYKNETSRKFFEI